MTAIDRELADAKRRTETAERELAQVQSQLAAARQGAIMTTPTIALPPATAARLEALVTQQQAISAVIEATIATLREALDVPGGRAAATGVTDWRSAPLELRDGKTNVPNRGLMLTWTAGSAPAYRLTLPDGAAAKWTLTPDDALSFVLINVLETGPPGAVTMELVTTDGTAVRLPLEHFGPLQPALPARLTKTAWIADMPGYQIATARPAEQVGQTYDLPLSAFVAANPAFAPGELLEIRFLFDGATAGEIVVDQVGFRRAALALP